MTAGSAKPKEYRVAGISMPGGYRLRGFTLIEMMIVVAIVAVLAAIAVPSFQDFMAKSRVKSATETVYSFISQARSESVIRDQNIYVSVNGGANWCLGFVAIPTAGGATTCDCTDNAPASCVVSVSGTDVTQVVSSADFPNISVATSTNNFTFDRLRGSVPAGQNGTIQISSGGWQLNTVISQVGRIMTCGPTGGDNKAVTGYESC